MVKAMKNGQMNGVLSAIIALQFTLAGLSLCCIPSSSEPDSPAAEESCTSCCHAPGDEGENSRNDQGSHEHVSCGGDCLATPFALYEMTAEICVHAVTETTQSDFVEYNFEFIPSIYRPPLFL